jgi:hypothetical protein
VTESALQANTVRPPTNAFKNLIVQQTILFKKENARWESSVTYLSSLGVRLIASLSRNDWPSDLSQCRTAVTTIRSRLSQHIYPPSAATFLTVHFPEIIKNVLLLQSVSPANATIARNFLSDAVSLVFSLTIENPPNQIFLPLLADIFDPSKDFYSCNEHAENSTGYSEHVVSLGRSLCESGQASHYTLIFSDPQYSNENCLTVSSLWQQLRQYVDPAAILPDISTASTSFSTFLGRFDSADPRKIPLRDIVPIVRNLSSVCHSPIFFPNPLLPLSTS